MSKQGTFLGIPYDWRPLTVKKLRSRTWNKEDHRLFTPRAYGWGYTINFYELFHHRKKLLATVIILIIFGMLVIRQP